MKKEHSTFQQFLKISCPSRTTSLGEKRLNVNSKQLAPRNNVSSLWRKMKFPKEQEKFPKEQMKFFKKHIL